MKKLTIMLVALFLSLGAIIVISCQGPSFHNPATTSTTNHDRDWHIRFLRTRLQSLQPKDGQVQITGLVFQSPVAQSHTVPAGYKLAFPDDHGHWIYTIARIESDGVVIEYESSFDHRSFGKNLITRDKGTFKLPWFTSTPTSASATQAASPSTAPRTAQALSRDEQVQLVVLERMLKSWGEIQPGPEQPQMNFLAVCDTLHLFGGKGEPRDPTGKVMAVLRTQQIKKFSECAVKKHERMPVADLQSGLPGRILWVGHIKWINDQTAETSAGIWENMKFGPGEMLRIHLEDGQWKITATGAWDT